MVHGTEKDRQRSELQERIAEYLEGGGVIEDVGNRSGVVVTPPRNRKSQVNFLKDKDYKRRKKR